MTILSLFFGTAILAQGNFTSDNNLKSDLSEMVRFYSILNPRPYSSFRDELNELKKQFGIDPVFSEMGLLSGFQIGKSKINFSTKPHGLGDLLNDVQIKSQIQAAMNGTITHNEMIHLHRVIGTKTLAMADEISGEIGAKYETSLERRSRLVASLRLGIIPLLMMPGMLTFGNGVQTALAAHTIWSAKAILEMGLPFGALAWLEIFANRLGSENARKLAAFRNGESSSFCSDLIARLILNTHKVH